ncbi:VWA domain-containing protein [Acidaminobacter sp. JC074]|uniref:VWA domain-containing protein n=1 Tax=Acidaminobacter sp. JC074 TaxID=2530199 RepID=UPI001F0FC4A5|nr:VWA domain-containing protein [Acidaminobacter sp. JC074]
MTTYIKHNLLDQLRINEVIDESVYLQRYLEEGYHHFDDFSELLKDLNFMLFKHVLLIDKPKHSNFHLELILELIKLRQVDRIRLRTAGSITNTYLCLKLILDNLFESIRGKSIIDDITKLIQEHEENNLDAVLTEKEKDLLDKLLNKENVKEANRADLVKEINRLLDYGDDSDFSKSVSKALNQSPKSFDDLLDKLDDPTEQDDYQDSNAESIEHGQIKEEMEKRFSSYMNKQLLTKANNFKKGQYQSEIENDKKESHMSYSDNQVSKDDELIHTEAYQLDHKSGQIYGHTPVDTYKTGRISEQDYQKMKSDLFKELKLDRIIHKAMNQVDQFEETTKTLGIHKKSMNTLSFDQVIKLYKRYKKPDFVSFINKVGKNKSFARQMQYRKRKKHAIPIDKVTASNKIDLLIDDEYISLALEIEAFENDFYDRYLKDDLLTIELINKFDKRKGPIILCYDGSGSMEGIKIEETKSHIIAIMEIAKIQKRHMVIIQFASASEPLYIKEINPKHITADDVLDIMDTFICGGTDFEKPLSKAIDYINMDKHKKSDILFITDGQCEIRQSFKDKFLRTKKSRDFKLYTMIMHSHTYHDYGDIAHISDEILEIHDRDFNNWNKTTKRMLYSLI